ncbi:hypothetical protein BGW38_010640 [Lunasporangiospora selenospora]|uniref:Uncharacterized protein n=1 Tax=Lunasporangiospora selenospora TaxID=979761 RepID=A0A9P6FWF5_9FUNG|nr:hypothetical protein BGW38_010640 [Lunasporangiospora selenospora]
MKSSILLSAAATLAVVAAQSKGADEGGLFYSEPITDTVWQAGKNHTISWTNNCGESNGQKLDVVLYRATGDNSTTMVRVPGIDALGSVNCVKENKAIVFLPASVAPGPWYAIHVLTKPNQSYSAQFSVSAADPTITTITTTAAPSSTTQATTSATVSANTTTTATDASRTPTPSTGNAAGSLKALGAATMAIAAGAAALLF